MLTWVVALGMQAASDRISAEAAMENYRRMIGGDSPTRCNPGNGSDITVCARRDGSAFRLPLPNERAGPGEVVRHPSEPPPATGAFRGPPGEPSRLMDTVRKGVGLVKSLVTGEDPGF